MPDFTGKQREKLASKGQAMPQGGFPIRNHADLKRAIQAIGRAKNPEAAKAWIKKRAKELKATHLLPEAWSVTHCIELGAEEVNSILMGGVPLMENVVNPPLDKLTVLKHHGVKGMQWGVRRRGILQARKNVANARGNLQKEQLKLIAGKSSTTKVSRARQAFLQHPDRSTAVLTTAGEKAVLAILLTPAAAVSVVGISRATSKGIEVRQAQRAKKK